MSELFNNMGVEIELAEKEDFLKVKETLSRIGVESRKEKKLFQSCHILHKRGQYAILHFKELFALDGKATDISTNDKERRNTITKLLSDWGLLKILDKLEFDTRIFAPMSQIKIIPFKEKCDWDLVPKYNIGNS